MRSIGMILLLGFMALICAEKVWSIVEYEDLDSPLRPRQSVIDIKREYGGIKSESLDSLVFGFLRDHLPQYADMYPKVELIRKLPHSDDDTIGVEYIYDKDTGGFGYRMFSLNKGCEFVNSTKPDTIFGYPISREPGLGRCVFFIKRHKSSKGRYTYSLREGFVLKVILLSGYIQSVEGVLFMRLLDHRRMWEAAFSDSLGPSRISPPQFAPPAEPLPVPALPKKKR